MTRQWPSTRQPVVTLPWNPCQTTHRLPILSNPKRYPTQIWREWACEVKYLGVWRDRGSKKPKGPKTPLCCDSKWRAIRDSAMEASTKDQWEEHIHYPGRGVLLPHRSALIRSEEHLRLRFWWQDRQRQFLFLYSRKNLRLLPVTW